MTGEIGQKVAELAAIASRELGIDNLLDAGMIRKAMVAELLDHRFVDGKPIDINGKQCLYLVCNADRYQINNGTYALANKYMEAESVYFAVYRNSEIFMIRYVDGKKMAEDINQALKSSGKNRTHINVSKKFLDSYTSVIYYNGMWTEDLEYDDD